MELGSPGQSCCVPDPSLALLVMGVVRALLAVRLRRTGTGWGGYSGLQSPLPDGGYGAPHSQVGTARLHWAVPLLLPLTLCLSQDGVMVLSATHRYKKKYVTTLLYKPI